MLTFDWNGELLPAGIEIPLVMVYCYVPRGHYAVRRPHVLLLHHGASCLPGCDKQSTTTPQEQLEPSYMDVALLLLIAIILSYSSLSVYSVGL